MNPPAGQYELDDVVTHGKYGLGRVILVEGDAAVAAGFAPEKKVRIIGAVYQDDQALTVAAGSTRAGSASAAVPLPR